MNKIIYLSLLFGTVLFSEEIVANFAEVEEYQVQIRERKEPHDELRVYPFVCVGAISGGWLYDYLPMVGYGLSARQDCFAADIEAKTSLLVSSASCSFSSLQYLNENNTGPYCSFGVGAVGVIQVLGKPFVGVGIPLRLGASYSDYLLCDVGVEFVHRFKSGEKWTDWKPLPEMRFGWRF